MLKDTVPSSWNRFDLYECNCTQSKIICEEFLTTRHLVLHGCTRTTFHAVLSRMFPSCRIADNSVLLSQQRYWGKTKLFCRFGLVPSPPPREKKWTANLALFFSSLSLWFFNKHGCFPHCLSDFILPSPSPRPQLTQAGPPPVPLGPLWSTIYVHILNIS